MRSGDVMNRLITLALALTFALALALSGCKSEMPPPWKEMYFPLSNSTLLPGAGPTGFKVKYSGITGKTKEYYREYASALKRGGYVFMEEAPNDDPQDGIMAGIFQKKEHRVRLTVYADAHTHAEVKEEVE